MGSSLPLVTQHVASKKAVQSIALQYFLNTLEKKCTWIPSLLKYYKYTKSSRGETRANFVNIFTYLSHLNLYKK